MGEEYKSQRLGSTPKSAKDKATKATPENRSGVVWVRADGAICVDNECIVLKRTETGSLGLTVDPDKCSCEARDALLNALVDTIVEGKGISLEIKPRKES